MLKLGPVLQRLFSTFPNSWPGAGLLLLRLCLATAALHFAVPRLRNQAETIAFVQQAIAAAGAIFLTVGLWTPFVGAAIALDEVWIALSISSIPREDAWTPALMAVLAVSIAMLGPGAWSIDARLFGRKRIDIHPTRPRRPSL